MNLTIEFSVLLFLISSLSLTVAFTFSSTSYSPHTTNANTNSNANAIVNPFLSTSSPSKSHKYDHSFTQLRYTDDDNNGSNNRSNNNNNNNNNKNSIKSTKNSSVRRTSMKGISVSPSGFLILLQTRSISNYLDNKQAGNGNTNANENNENSNSSTSSTSNNKIEKNIILPLRITSTQKDAFATTSAESLTICQLLSGVDMAGAILSPDVLKNIVGLYCSSSAEEEEEEQGQELLGMFVEDELGLDMPIKYDDHEEEDYDDNVDANYDGVADQEEKNYDYMQNIFRSTNSNSDSNQKSLFDDNAVKEFVHNFLSTSLGPGTNSFEEASTYQRSRAIFPKISLDAIRIDLPSSVSADIWMNIMKEEASLDEEHQQQEKEQEKLGIGSDSNLLAPLPLQFVLECRIDNDKTLDIPLHSEFDVMTKSIQEEGGTYNGYNFDHEMIEESRNIMQQVLYSYDDQCSGVFLSMALALRYKCPIVITSRALEAIEDVQNSLEGMDGLRKSICIQHLVKSYHDFEDTDNDEDCDDDDNEDMAIQSILPQWRSTSALQDQSQRVVENIEQGFQVTKLQGALKIALQRGDEQAAEKIRAEIDKLLRKDE